MVTRRRFLVWGAGAATVVGVPGCAVLGGNRAEAATAITQVFGDGMKLTGVAVQYREAVRAASLNQADFSVAGRTVTAVYVSETAGGAPAESGRFVVMQLDPADAAASLVVKQKPSQTQQAKMAAGGGPGKAGDVKESAPSLKQSAVPVRAGGQALVTQNTINQVFDDFRQFEFADSQSGKTVRYNLFAPKNRQAGQRYPIVLFMHDAGVTGKNTQATMYQGNGAIAWATPEAQAENPCFVLAPQFDEIIADDDSQTSAYLDATIHLIRALEQQYPIDPQRRYATGQSGGGMLSIAMNVKYPDFFAASYLVACQWDAKVVAPMAKNKLWITVSEDDAKAYPGQQAIVKALAAHGAKTARAVWDAKWTPAQFQTAFNAMDKQHANVNFVAFAKGTVFAEGESTSGGSGHTNTWKFAYNIAPVRKWIFRQRQASNKAQA